MIIIGPEVGRNFLTFTMLGWGVGQYVSILQVHWLTDMDVLLHGDIFLLHCLLLLLAQQAQRHLIGVQIPSLRADDFEDFTISSPSEQANPRIRMLRAWSR